MKVILENFNGQHLGLLKEMAEILKFKFKAIDNDLPKTYLSSNVSQLEENDLTLFSMQASGQSLAELWDKEDDNYWNSYLETNV